MKHKKIEVARLTAQRTQSQLTEVIWLSTRARFAGQIMILVLEMKNCRETSKKSFVRS